MFRWAIAAILAALLLPAAALAYQTNPVVRGNVSYGGAETLPAGATLSVQLQDVSLQDAPATQLAQQNIDVGGRRPPFAYELRYNPVSILPNRRYVVRAEIRVRNVTIYSSQGGVAVLSAGNPTTADITVQRTTNALPDTSAGLPLVGLALLGAAGLTFVMRRRLART
jgi:putative lipoprotein